MSILFNLSILDYSVHNSLHGKTLAFYILKKYCKECLT